VDLMVGNNQIEDSDFKVDDQGVLRFRGRICIPDNVEMKKMILEESHRRNLSIHPGATKMYHDLKKLFWWSGLKRDVAQFVYSCLICQKSKVEHQKPAGLLTPLDVPEWKSDSISMDFVTSLPNTPRGHDAIWVINIISGSGIVVDPSKVDAVLQWETPKLVTEVISFLGLAGYYHRFIEGFSKLALPLTQLTCKGKAFVWDVQCENSFNELKQRLTTAPILIKLF